MANPIYTIHDKPDYNTAIEAITTQTPAHAETVLRPLFEAVINNTEYVRQRAEAVAAGVAGLTPGAIGADPAGSAAAVKAALEGHTAAANPHSGSVPTGRRINGRELTADVTLSAADVGARASNWMPTAAEVGAVPKTQVATATTAGILTNLNPIATAVSYANGTYALTLPNFDYSALTGLANITFKAPAAATAAVSISINGSAAIPVYAGADQLGAGDIEAGVACSVTVDKASGKSYIKSGGGGGYVRVEYRDYAPAAVFEGAKRSELPELTMPESYGYRGGVAASGDGAGNVLFGGGAKGNLVDRYNTAGTKTILSNLSQAREYLSAATDGAGNVLFGGGRIDGSFYTNVDRYNTSGARTTLNAMSQGRASLAASSDNAGNVLFAGGVSTSQSAVVDKYNTSGTRTTLTSLSQAKSALASSQDGSGNVLIGGGRTQAAYSATVDCYATNGAKTTRTVLSRARSSLAAAMDQKGNVLFGGGYDEIDINLSMVDRYDIAGAHTLLVPLSHARYGLVSTTMGSGNVLFGGGSTTNSISGGWNVTFASARVELYDSNGNRATLPNLFKGRSTLAAATDGLGSALFGGGSTNEVSGTSSSVHRYSLEPMAALSLTQGSKYQFNDDTDEQTAANNMELIKPIPLTGYIKYKAGTLS